MRLRPSLAWIVTGWAIACGGGDRPGRFDDSHSVEAQGGPAAGGDYPVLLVDAGSDSHCADTPLQDSAGYCGNTIFEAEHEKTNLYFVVDRSASMQDSLPDGEYSKYQHARIAIAEVLAVIGHRVQYGAAVFPGRATNECEVGAEMFPTQSGDAPGCVDSGEFGPTLDRLMTALAVLGTGGGTPTSPTLRRLLPTLAALPGKTSVVLVTDGAPNCNPDAACAPADCLLTNSGLATSDGEECSRSHNCCDPELAPDGPNFCIDTAASKEAVHELREAGIQTFVIGMPGSEEFASHLGDLAELGGTARESGSRYYPVTNTGELSDALREIGVNVALTCEIGLSEPPSDPDLVNVYFDGVEVPWDPNDGWDWADPGTVTLQGAACDSLRDGLVLYVQVMVGCPTIIR